VYLRDVVMGSTSNAVVPYEDDVALRVQFAWKRQTQCLALS
jgi:hypothetical protein